MPGPDGDRQPPLEFDLDEPAPAATGPGVPPAPEVLEPGTGAPDPAARRRWRIAAGGFGLVLAIAAGLFVWAPWEPPTLDEIADRPSSVRSSWDHPGVRRPPALVRRLPPLAPVTVLIGGIDPHQALGYHYTDTVYELVLIDLDSGVVLWRHHLDYNQRAEYTPGAIVLTRFDDAPGVEVLSPADGRTRWKRNTSTWTAIRTVPHGLYQVDGSTLALVDALTQKVVRSADTGIAGLKASGLLDVNSDHPLVVAAGTEDRQLRAFRRGSLREVWRSPGPARKPVGWADGLVITQSDDRTAYSALELETGRTVWSRSLTSAAADASALVVGGRVAAVSYPGRARNTMTVVSWDLRTGAGGWTVDFQGHVGSGQPDLAPSSGVFYLIESLTGRSDRIEAVDVVSGTRLWSAERTFPAQALQLGDALVISSPAGLEFLR